MQTHFTHLHICTNAETKSNRGLQLDREHLGLRLNLELDPSHVVISSDAKILPLKFLENICSKSLLERVQNMDKYRKVL